MLYRRRLAFPMRGPSKLNLSSEIVLLSDPHSVADIGAGQLWRTIPFSVRMSRLGQDAREGLTKT